MSILLQSVQIFIQFIQKQTVPSNKVGDRFYEFKRLSGVEDTTRPPQMTVNGSMSFVMDGGCHEMERYPDSNLSMKGLIVFVICQKFHNNHFVNKNNIEISILSVE